MGERLRQNKNAVVVAFACGFLATGCTVVDRYEEYKPGDRDVTADDDTQGRQTTVQVDDETRITFTLYPVSDREGWGVLYRQVAYEDGPNIAVTSATLHCDDGTLIAESERGGLPWLGGGGIDENRYLASEVCADRVVDPTDLPRLVAHDSAVPSSPSEPSPSSS